MPWQGRQRKVLLWANRNELFYVLDRTDGRMLLGKPFVEVNWMTGFDGNGRPIRAPGKVRGAQTLILPGNATNFYSPSYSPRTGLLYVPALERGSQGGATQRSTPGYAAVRALDPRTGNRRWEFKHDTLFTGGVLTTASDLLFTATSDDPVSERTDGAWEAGYLYALDARTGHQLWKRGLTDAATSGIITYAVDGRQYVAVASRNNLFAFTLRE